MKKFTQFLLLITMLVSLVTFSQGNLDVSGLGTNIVNGDSTPSTTDDTDFGTLALGGNNPNTFTIYNVGNSDLDNITITITGSPYFTPASQNIGKIKKTKSANHTITYNPTAYGVHTATVTITSSNSGIDVPFTFTITGNCPAPGPEIDVTGLGNSITSGDITPSTADDTDFGNSNIGTPVSHTFTIQNSGGSTLTLGAITFTGANATEFTVTTPPTSPVAASGSTTFVVQFLPLGTGTRTATISIVNNDTTGGENPYMFALQGTGVTPPPEINITGLGATIVDGDTTPTTVDDTDFGNVDITVGTNPNTFTIQNTGSGALNLTAASPYVVISGAHAADFTLTANPTTPIAASGSTTFTITFNPSAVGLRTAAISIANDDSDENPYNFNIQGTGTTSVQEINVTGLGNDILTGDVTPTTTDNTDFGSVLTTGGTNPNTFIIENLGTVNPLLLTGASPYVAVSGANAADFTVTTIPGNSIAASSSTSFVITFNPSADGLRTATLTIANNDPNEGSYTFNIQGTGYTPPPCGTTVVHTADFETGLDGWTDGGTDAQRISNAGRSYSNSYSLEIRNLDATGNNSSVLSPLFDFSSYDKVDFKFFFTSYSGEDSDNFIVEFSNNSGSTWTVIDDFICMNPINKNADYAGGTTIIFYSKTSTMFKSVHTFPAGAVSQIRVRADGTDTSDLIYIDYVTITGTQNCSPTTAPGGVTGKLDLWLRADKVDGTTVGTDGANVSKWTDIGKGNHAETVVSGQEPVYRNNATKNINFNPVVEFENNNTTAAADMTYINTRDELKGTGGFNSNDIFAVIIPDPTITTSMWPLDTFTSSDPTGTTFQEDVTGFGYGSYTNRFTGEYFTYAIGTTTGPGNGYGRADTGGSTNYNQIGIINTRHNTSNNGIEIYLNANQVGTSTSDAPDFAAVNNTRYWIGRSQYWNGSFDGRIAELVTYNSRLTDGVSERLKIESYLALKYGITLGVNGTSQNYLDSSGNIVWDATNSVGYCYDIAGIFRDDTSNHSQKQSKSVNSSSVLTIAHKDIYATNSANTNSFDTDLDYLVWGHNNGALTGSNMINVNLGASSTSVTTLFDRRWKIYESRPTGSNDILEVKLSIPGAVLPALSDPTTEEYAMIVSNDASFALNTIVDVIPLTANGSDYETWYDFDYTRFFTFGIASKVTGKYDVEFTAGDFLVGEDSVDLNSTYSVSSWVRNTGSGGTIVSKGTAYDFKIDGSGKVQAVLNGSTRLTSATSVNDSKWHHVAFTYTGSTLRLYIDGVEDGNSPSTAVPVPTSTSHRFAIGINYTDKNNFTTSFNGSIDEVRIWDSALSQTEIQYIMNQEIIEHTDNTVDGAVLPHNITRNEVNSIPWGDLQAYHNINAFYGTTVEDGSNNDHWVRIKYLVRGKAIIDDQTAPLPYGSNGSGTWDTSTTWKNGSELYIPGSASLVDPNVTVDWNIASISHNVTMDNASLPAVNLDNRTLLGLIADSTNELTISSDNAVTVTHYLELNGSIDLEGESQLIQTDKSVLEVGANGSLERDQQGTSDVFTYNYWSSPVGAVNSTATNDTYTHRYTVPDVLSDGTNPAVPGPITFISAGVYGSASPFGIADYWIWKFANQLDDDYSSWQHMRSTGTIYAGEGYTMKGPGTGSILTPQNYVFEGKPNNGDITLTISGGNDYLVGNPYASAIDSHGFLDDNPATSGTLYFWEHWGGGSHHLHDYQGGYALYNYSGGIPTASYGTNDPDVATGGTPTKLPGRYIPVSQGFFVYSPGGGTITFENDQRVFEKEGATSVFVRSAENQQEQPTNYNEDTRMKFRIGFNSVNTIHRQLLLTVDENASVNYDWGYDGRMTSQQIDDMYWMLEGEQYGIQGVNIVTAESVFPLGIHVRDNGLNSIQIDHLENVPDNVQIYVRDNELRTYHNLRQSEYEFNLNTGEHLNRFEIVFSNRQDASLDVSDNELNNMFDVYYNNDSSNLIIRNVNLIEINSVELFNIIGQSIYSSNETELNDYSEIKISDLSSGTYIINMDTAQGKLSKKVLID